MSQEKYINDMLAKYNMLECKPASTPMDVGTKLSNDMSPKSDSETLEISSIPYKSAVGSLMYAMTSTRPDISYSVSAVSKYCSNYGPAHWQAVKRILRYLKGTAHYRLKLGGTTSATLTGYCDADWAGDLDDRRSTSGYVFYIGNGVVSWSSKKQPTVALSTVEAEYMSSTHATKEAIWLKQLLAEIEIHLDGPVLMYNDNQGCIQLAKNPAQHQRTKHIDLRHHYIREKLESGEITLQYCSTEDMVADLLTKALSKDKHNKCLDGLGLKHYKVSQSGSIVSNV
jgi:hypothetical protein